MRRKRGQPAYSLDVVKQLIKDGRCQFTRRGRKFVQNHYHFDYQEICSELFERISESDFYKSEELRVIPGVFADIYIGMRYDDTDWYVKFYVDECGEATVTVMTMCWDGADH